MAFAFITTSTPPRLCVCPWAVLQLIVLSWLVGDSESQWRN